VVGDDGTEAAAPQPQTTAGPVTLQRPKLHNTTEAFASRFSAPG
jgi:hypothetical protein